MFETVMVDMDGKLPASDPAVAFSNFGPAHCDAGIIYDRGRPMAVDHDADPDHGRARQLAETQTKSELETLIFLLRPLVADQADTIAREQIERHGSLPAVLFSSRHAANPDTVIAHLAAVQDALTVASRGILSRAPIIGTSENAALYLMVTMAHLSVEHLRVLFLNTKNRLIAEEDFGRGTIDQTPIFPREILKRALEVGAASVIVAHNHPSGEPKPSNQDVAITKRLATGADALSIAVLDHIIIASSGWTSLRAEGLI